MHDLFCKTNNEIRSDVVDVQLIRQQSLLSTTDIEILSSQSALLTDKAFK